MSDARHRIYAFIRDRIRAGDPPTVREIQAALGYRSVKSAQEQIDRLVRDGLLRRTEGRSRSLRLAGAEGVPVAGRVPLLGRIQAGAFDLASQEIESYVAGPARGAAGDHFALRVHGQSMIGAHILDGDVVLVRRQPQVESGQIVAALVDDEATLKIFRRRGRRIELHPANPAYSVLRPPPEALRILGRVVEVRRALT